MRTLVATVLENDKGKRIYCAARKIKNYQLDVIRHTDKKVLEENGFTFIRMISLEYPNIKGHAIFYEGHIDFMTKTLKDIQ